MATYLDELVQKITTKADLKGFDDLDRKQKRAIKSNDLLAQSFRRAFGIFFGIQGIRSVIQTTRDLDLLRSSIEGLTKSTQDWEYLRKEAERTGTSFKTLAGAYKNFYSSANMAGFNKNQIQEMFSDVLTAGRGVGVSQQQMGMALLAMEQMLSKGKVSMEELRRQLGNAMPGAFELAAKAMGVTTEQLNELVEKGLDARVLLPKLTKEMKNYYMEAYLKNIHTLDAELIRLDNAWQDFQKSILQGEAGEALAQLVRDVTKILRSQTLLRFIQLISKALGFVIKHLKLILLLFGIKTIYNTIRALKALHWAIIDVATSTGVASAATEALAMSYALITSGSVLAGVKLLTKAMWAMCAPLLKLGTILAGVVSWFMILQDLWLTFSDKDADTMTRRFAGTIKDQFKQDVPNVKPITREDKDKVVDYYRKQGYKVNFSNTPDGMYQFQGLEDIKIPSGSITAAPSNNSANYSSSQGQTNNLTINITAPNSQPEAIAQATEDALYGFFTKYNMGFA